MGSKLGPVSAFFVLSFLFLGPGTADPARAAKELLLPDWAAVFNADGSLRDDYDADGAPGANGVPDHEELWNGLNAWFLDDILSDGEAVDLSTFNGAADLDEAVIDNGLVDGSDDLGNSFVVTMENLRGELEVYVGVETLSHALPSYVEFELNQDAVGAGTGRPWPMTGTRQDGDLLVRMELDQGLLIGVRAFVWDAGAGRFVQVAAAAGDGAGAGCASVKRVLLACKGDPVMESHNDLGRWGLDSEPLDPLSPDSFVEAGVNVEALLGYWPQYRAVHVKTPADISLLGL